MSASINVEAYVIIIVLLRIAPTELQNDEREAHSLIANVAGRVLMLQKDKPAAERSTKKVRDCSVL